ncbi:MAG: hypothetical protein PVH37_25950 [Desulfobacterales bacterium]|jgi:hypothetical protein
MRESEEINHAMMIMASKATKSARIPEASVPKNGKKAKGRKLKILKYRCTEHFSDGGFYLS